jgi:predicted metalloprotease with PDZ domain
VRLREETKGKVSLDDVVRGILAKGGDGEHVWTVAETIRVGDELSGTNVLSKMYETYVLKGEQVDVDAEFRALGVDRTGIEDEVTIHDDRPRSWIRQQIVSKDGH